MEKPFESGISGLGHLVDLLITLRGETSAKLGHPDRNAVHDVWRSVFDEIEAMGNCEAEGFIQEYLAFHHEKIADQK